MNVARTANKSRKDRKINEKVCMMWVGRLFSAGKMTPNPLWMEVKIERPAQKRLNSPKIPMAVVSTFNRPIFIKKFLSKFSLTLLRKVKKVVEKPSSEPVHFHDVPKAVVHGLHHRSEKKGDLDVKQRSIEVK